MKRSIKRKTENGKWLLIFLALFTIHYSLFTPPPAAAQTPGGTVPIKWVSALPSKCETNQRPKALVYKYTATSGIYYCSATDTWTLATSAAGVLAGAGNGTAAAPAFSFTSDSDTGMFRSGANALGFSTGGTERGTLSSAGLFTTTGGISTTTGAFSGTVTSTQGTITTSQPALTHTATWNDGGVTFTNIFSNVTNTASAAASKLIDLQVGGTSQFNVTRAGIVTTAGAIELGNASDTTVARSGAGDVTIEGNAIYRAGGTDVPVADGGTGASTIDAALTNLGILRSYLASTVTYNNTDTLADTALSVTVVSSGIYDIELTVHGTSAVRGLAFDFGGTASVTNFVGQWQSTDATATILAGLRVIAAGTDFNASHDGIDGYVNFKGTIEVNAGGTFLLRGAQGTAHPSNTTILRGSTLILRKLN